MSDMKCPFCQQELKHEKTTGIYCCPKTFIDCPLGLGTGAFGTKELWQELIYTRKALEIALDAIDKGEAALIGCQEADDKYISDVTAEYGLELMSKAYKQIKALTERDEE